MSEWQPIETAPRDGTPFQARIAGYGDDNIISWVWGLRNDDDLDCGGWSYTEGEPPQCWTDGICWAENEDGVPSARPTHWKPLSATHWMHLPPPPKDTTP